MNPRRTTCAIGSSVALGLFLLAACTQVGSCGSNRVAALVETHGRVQRDFAQSVGNWRAAEAHAEFARGDGLRTGPNATALLAVGRNGRLRIESETTVRFGAKGRGTAADSGEQAFGLEVETGHAVLESAESELAIHTAAGAARLRPGTQLRLEPSERGQRFTVLIGGADVTAGDGRSTALGAGQSMQVGIGLAVLDDEPRAGHEPDEKARAVPARSAPAPAGAEAEAEPHAESGALLASVDRSGAPLAAEAARDPRPQARASDTRVPELPNGDAKQMPDLSVRVGLGFRVYDPAPPTIVAFSLGNECSAGAELRLAGKPPLRGERRFVVALNAGIHRYGVHCMKDGAPATSAAASATVLVLKSDGTRPLPQKQPHNDLDVDGRKYTLMYQNLRPIVQLRWPSAPAAPGYVLQIELPNGERKSWRAKEPRYTLDTASLSDGSYKLEFETAGRNPAHSKQTTLALAFDNAAPTAAIQKPPPEGFTPGTGVALAGVAVAGSRAFVEGKELHLDAQQRFNTRVELPPGERTLAIRFQHPKQGVRYYVRRALGTSR